MTPPALALDDLRWATLVDVMGEAGSGPRCLAALDADAVGAMDDLWTRFCHQGSVTAASYAVAPHVVDRAVRWDRARRLPALSFVGAVASAARTAVDVPDFLAPAFDAALAVAAEMCLRDLAAVVDERDALWLLVALAACAGRSALARALEAVIDADPDAAPDAPRPSAADRAWLLGHLDRVRPSLRDRVAALRAD